MHFADIGVPSSAYPYIGSSVFKMPGMAGAIGKAGFIFFDHQVVIHFGALVMFNCLINAFYTASTAPLMIPGDIHYAEGLPGIHPGDHFADADKILAAHGLKVVYAHRAMKGKKSGDNEEAPVETGAVTKTNCL